MGYFDYFYCRKCGRISTVKPNDYSCDVCSTQMCRVREQYLDSCGLMTEEKEQIVFDKFIKNSSQFDPAMYKIQKQYVKEKVAKIHAEEKRDAKDAAIISALRAGADPKTAFVNKGQNMPKCPTCGSTNIQKISGTKRWLSTGLFGLASSDIGKSMVCRSCGFKW